MVFCKDGHCRSVSPEEFLANTFSKEALIVEESLAARSQKKNKKSSSKKNRNKKSKNKKNNKVEAEPPLNLADMLPKEGENTGNLGLGLSFLMPFYFHIQSKQIQHKKITY